MKISTENWQNKIPTQPKASGNPEETDEKTRKNPARQDSPPAAGCLWRHGSSPPQCDPATTAASSTSGQPSGAGKIKSSVPDDQVGQLAMELANSRAKMDVQQVASKVMRSLAQLKMSCAVSEGEDKKKILQIIRRTERLLKRTRTKLRCLTKEEQLENRQKRAEEKKQKEQAREIQKELRNRRTKRRREEREYALKEAAQDIRSATSALPTPTVGAETALLPSSVTTDAAMSVSSAVSLSDAAAAPTAESVSLDVTI